MSTNENSTSGASSFGSGTLMYPTTDQAAIASAHRSIKKSFDLFPSLDDKLQQNLLDSVLVKTYLLVAFYPEKVIPAISVDDMEDMTSLFPSVE